MSQTLKPIFDIAPIDVTKKVIVPIEENKIPKLKYMKDLLIFSFVIWNSLCPLNYMLFSLPRNQIGGVMSVTIIDLDVIENEVAVEGAVSSRN